MKDERRLKAGFLTTNGWEWIRRWGGKAPHPVASRHPSQEGICGEAGGIGFGGAER
jgi:hypothetical protein